MDLTWIWRSLWDSLPLPTVDWFWWDYALFLAPIVGVWLLLLWLVRFLPDGAKPYVLAVLTFGLGAAWAYWKRRQDELKRKPPPAKPRPPSPPTWPPWGS